MSYLRSIPPLLVLVLFPVLVVAVFIAIVAVVLLWAVHGGKGGAIVIGLFVLVSFVGGFFYAIREYRGRPRPRIDGPELSRADAPALWAMVDELARDVQTRAPARIVVSADVGAAVVEIRGERILSIGLPTLVTFTQAQLRAVLAHELGHFAGGRYALSSFLLRAQGAMIAIARNADGFWALLFRGYAKAYIWAEQASAREMEHDADRFSARLAGAGAAASALEQVVRTDIAWTLFNREYVERYFPLTGKRGPLAEGLRSLLAANGTALEKAARESIASAQPSAWSTHPLIRDRIARVRSVAAAGPTGSPRPALELVLRDLDRLETGILAHADLPLTSWDELARTSRQEYDRKTALRVAASVQERLNGAAPTPRTVLVSLAATPLDTDPPDLAPKAIVFDALQRADDIRFVHAWDGPGHFADAHGVVTPSELLGDGTPAGLPALLVDLDRRGADLDLPYDLSPLAAEAAARASEGDLLATMTHATTSFFGFPPRDLLVFRSGVLLSPSRVNGFAMLAGASRKDRQLDRVLRKIEERGIDGLRAERNAIWIPRDRLVGARLKGTTVRLRIAGRGKELRVAPSQYTVRAGDLAAALGAAGASGSA